MTVRTRFAPSPTGYLHIGGVRTALFNWLFARHHGGTFILRIDDTDTARNVDEALQPILDGLLWLGIDWDEGPRVGGPHEPYFQSQRADRHCLAVEALLASGHAYRDFSRPEELDLERKAAQAAGAAFIYSRRFAAMTDADCNRFIAEGRSSVVRLKMPRTGSLTIVDLVRGPVEFAWQREQDHVIQRANGSCLYHLASVVDDQDLAITHVIRAEEHLSNTPRQAFIAMSLGYKLPTYAHLPLVAEPGSRTKLSKRKLSQYLKNSDFSQITDHGTRIAERVGLTVQSDTFNPVVVDFYREVGYLPWAIVNYLALLGWSYDDHTEFFSRDELISRFSLEKINSSPASFDPKKLWAVQDHYMRGATMAEKLAVMLPFLQRAGLVPSSPTAETLSLVQSIVEASGDRLKVAGDVLAYADFFLVDHPLMDQAAVRLRLEKPGIGSLLGSYRKSIAELSEFSKISLEESLKKIVADAGLKTGDFVHAVRVAVTGKTVGPGLYDCLFILGRESVLRRIDSAIKLCPPATT